VDVPVVQLGPSVMPPGPVPSHLWLKEHGYFSQLEASSHVDVLT
jgi:hypothetical protein